MNEQMPNRKKRSVYLLIIQSAWLLFVVLFGWAMFIFMSKTSGTYSEAQRFSEAMSMYQYRFWAFLFVGGAVASSIGGWGVIWKQIQGLRYFNLVAILLLIFAFLAMNFLAYHLPYTPCPFETCL